MFDIAVNLLLIGLGTMLRQRLVRQSAMSINSSNESANMPSPPPLRRRRNSQDSKLYKQLSSDSLVDLLASPPAHRNSEERRGTGGRRHSVTCGVLYTDMQKQTLKTAFNCAVRHMSGACSLLSSAPSSTYNLSSPTQGHSSRKKENEVILPQVLDTFRQSMKPPINSSQKVHQNHFQVNRRFSTDCPPPTYTEATVGYKQAAPRHKLLTRQHEAVSSKGSLVALEDE